MVSESNPLIRAKRRAGRVKRWIKRKVYERNIGKQYKAWLAEAAQVEPGTTTHDTTISIIVPVYNPPVTFLQRVPGVGRRPAGPQLAAGGRR